MAGKLIVLTGLDGSGTSSVAEELHKLDTSSSLFNSISSPHTTIRSHIDETVESASLSAHYYFYLSATIYTSTLIECKLEHGNVYCVRHLIDTVVSHRVNGLDVQLEYENKLFYIRKPDLIIYLDLNENVRQERITKRGKGFLDKKLDDNGFRARFLAEFERFSEHFIRLEVTNKSVLQIAQDIYNLIST
jgi:thymidylate kinase